MKWDEMAVVGHVARAHGLRGQVIVNPETDFPDRRFVPGAELYVSRGGAVAAVRLTTVRFQQGRPIIGFAGVDSIDAVEGFVGLDLRVPVECLVQLPAGAFYRHDLVGCRVETSAGRVVGTVTEVEGTADAGRLVVAAGDDEILIPLASEICTAIDAAGKRIVIEPPAGLLELNR